MISINVFRELCEMTLFYFLVDILVSLISCTSNLESSFCKICLKVLVNKREARSLVNKF